MRTTVDLPADLHQLATSIAHDTRQTLSQVLTGLIRRGLTAMGGPGSLARDPATGLAVMSGSGVPITLDDVRSLDDDT